MDTGIYIHIPFCVSKCNYCDFCSFPQKEHLFYCYVDALIKEINNCKLLEGCNIETVFIGGGTPTVLPASLITRILEALYRYKVKSGAEITIEANPGTLDDRLCRGLKAAGVNRVSMGLQAWQDSLLEKLGRTHKRADFLKSYEALRDAGFDNINIDLMFSLPGQTMDDWHETLEAVICLNPAHLSVYSLMIEEGTLFGSLREKGLLKETDDETDRWFYSYTKKFLQEKGYDHYEISNFARPSLECRHNIGYWRRRNYLGFGLAAHSFFEGVRFSNKSDLEEYLLAAGDTNHIRKDLEIIGRKESREEFFFLGLRMMDGISMKEYEAEFGEDMLNRYGEAIAKLKEQELLAGEGDRLYLTDKGIDISNYVFGYFIE